MKYVIATIFLLFIVGSAGLQPIVAQESPIRAAAPIDFLQGVDLNRVVLRFDCANPAEKTPRCLHPNIIAAGSWSKYFAQHVKPEIDWMKSRGVKRPRIIINNPYGLEGPGKNYAFTQRQLCAANKDTAQFAYGLADELRALKAANVDVIVYVGSFLGDPTEGLIAKDPLAALDAWKYAIAELIQGGAKIGFDYSHDLPPAADKFIEQIETITPTFREPRLLAGKTGRIVITDTFWQRTDPAVYADAKWAAKNSAHTEVIRLMEYPDGDAGWNDRHPGDVASRLAIGAKRIQADGHYPGVAAGWWSKN